MSNPDDKTNQPTPPPETKISEGIVTHTSTPRTTEARAAQQHYREKHDLTPNQDAAHMIPHAGGGKTTDDNLCTASCKANRWLLPGAERMMIDFSKEAPTHVRAEASDNILTHKISTVQENGELKPAPVTEVSTKLDADIGTKVRDAVELHAKPGENTKDLYSAKPGGGCHPYVI